LPKDISRRLSELSSRERKELVRVMEPILFHDLDFILDTMETADEFLSLPDAAVGAGCAGTRMELLAVLVGAHYRNGDLPKRAEKHLNQMLVQRCKTWNGLPRNGAISTIPTARSLKPFLVRYKNQEALLTVFAGEDREAPGSCRRGCEAGS
jgi:hypothetical protein